MLLYSRSGDFETHVFGNLRHQRLAWGQLDVGVKKLEIIFDRGGRHDYGMVEDG